MERNYVTVTLINASVVIDLLNYNSSLTVVTT